MSWFKQIHATADSPHSAIAIAALLAEWPLVLAAALTTWRLLRRQDHRGALWLVEAMCVALLIELFVSAFAFHARPFAVGFGPAWVAHAANNSMPSAHVTIVLIMTIVLALRNERTASVIVLILAIILAWARVYVGIHWPADMVGAVLSAILSVVVACGLHNVAMVIVVRRKKRVSSPSSSIL